MDNRNKKWFSILSTVCILGGIILILYPPFTSFYSRMQQNQLAQDFEQEEETQQQKYQSPIIFNLHQEETPKEQPKQEPKQKAIFLLNIPSIRVSVGVVEGTRPNNLRVGPGWYPQSALPVQGNTAIAGHLNVYGSWFRNLKKLKSGDKITLTYKSEKFVYSVERVFPIESTDWSVIEPCGYPALTLTTCDPQGSPDKRLAVRARLDQQQ